MGLADREYTKRDKDEKLQCLSNDEPKINKDTCSDSLSDKIRCSLQSLCLKIKRWF